MYGLDADLIMLGLTTHEPYFSLLREDVLKKKVGGKKVCMDMHVRCLTVTMYACVRGVKTVMTMSLYVCAKHRSDTCTLFPQAADKPEEYHLLHLNMLREYWAHEFSRVPLPFAFDLERIIDDIVMMCFFVGNDFLPRLPGLDIAEGGLNELLDMYKGLLPTLGGYVIDHGVAGENPPMCALCMCMTIHFDVALGRWLRFEKGDVCIYMYVYV